tara:strand:- start:1341 stop:2645 length:1305 start_codon:yes stop_codon:yes gene_type:complete
MGSFVIFFLVLCVFYYDAKTLENEDQELYVEIFGLKPLIWALASIVFFLVLIPIYYHLRRRFFKRRRQKFLNEGLDSFKTTNFSLITDFTTVVLIWFLLLNWTFLLYKALSYFVPFLNGKLLEFVVLGLVSHLFTIGIIFCLVRANKSESFFEIISFKKVKKWFFYAFLVPVAIGAFFASSSFFFFNNKDDQAITPLGDALTGSSIVSFLLFIVSVIFFAPLLEEVIFRGYFYRVFYKLRGKLFAIILISCLFALFHLDQIWGSWFALLAIFSMGLSVTLLRAWTGSIIPSIVAHYSYNISLVILPFLILYSLNPDYARYQHLGFKFDSRQREELLLKSIENKPDFSDAYNDLAWIYSQEGENLNEALILINKGLELSPENPYYLDTKAEVLCKMGRFEEAIVIEEEVVSDNPQDEFFKEQLEKFKSATAKTAK